MDNPGWRHPDGATQQQHDFETGPGRELGWNGLWGRAAILDKAWTQEQVLGAAPTLGPIETLTSSEGLGVPATRATTAGELAREFARALAEPGPHLIEVVLS